jgi:hypothetical protein
MRWLAALALAAAAHGADPVQLRPYPQKIRTFFALSDPSAPAAVRRSPDRLPAGETTAVATTGDGAVWIGSRQGLMRFDKNAGQWDRWQYFAGKRYLPDDEIVQLYGEGESTIWVRTATGISRIQMRPMTLAQKADLFEERIRDRHDRYGMVADSRLREPGNLASSQLSDSDNDGLWTSVYAAAECFRYAVTKSPDALDRARRAVEAVLFLEQVTGRPGFPARTYIRRGDTRGQGGEWHWTADGQIEWKADTSSDEIVGHFFILGVAHDLLPDEDLKLRIRATARRIMDHILSNGYNLVDVDGKPTTWGKWTWEYFQSPAGKSDGPLNALELLAFLKTASHLTGDSKYEDEYRKVALDLKYLEHTQRLLELREQINYSDEELAMLPFYLLFQYERDPKLLEGYRNALDQWWRNIQRERNPLWTFIYLTGRPDAKPDLDAAAWTLYRFPMDLVTWGVKNAHRRDIDVDPRRDRHRRPQALTLLAPDERPVMKWNENPFRLDAGGSGMSEDDGAAFLLPYWMGRHHGFLQGE